MQIKMNQADSTSVRHVGVELKRMSVNSKQCFPRIVRIRHGKWILRILIMN